MDNNSNPERSESTNPKEQTNKLFDPSKGLVEDTESVFMLDEECKYNIKKESDNTKEKNNNSQLLSPSFEIFNVSTTKKETTKNPNVSTKNVTNKTNTPKSIEKIIYTLPDLDKNQTYSEDKDDVFRDFDFTEFECCDETKDNDMEITDNETEGELVKPPYTSDSTEIVKKEQETLQNNYNIFVVADSNIILFNDYTQNISFQW